MKWDTLNRVYSANHKAELYQKIK